MNSKTKTIALVAGFILFTVLMYWFGFGIIGNKNQTLSDSIASRKAELESLQKEQKSFEQGKKDLAELQKASFPPDELFSRDTKVVKEIQQLEENALRYNLTLTIAVSGNINTAAKVEGTSGELFTIPYTMSLKGTAQNILQFMQSTEHLPFVTYIKNVSIVASAEDVRAALLSEFYVKK